jgi:2-dehydropantoate 2-reductase
VAEIAVVGPGAIGCVAGSALVASGRHRVTLCARTGFDKVSIRRKDGSGDLEVPVTTVTSETQVHPSARPSAWVLVCTKAHQTASAAGWFRALVGPESVVAVLQNGVEHVARLAPLVPPGTRIVPVVVRCPAERVAPGEIILRSPALLIVPDTVEGRNFAELFAGTPVSVATTADFLTAAWEKLCQNAASGAITALTEQPLSVMREGLVADLARQIIEEGIAVGRAEGARLDASLASRLVGAMAAMPDAEHAGNSMYYDRLAGRALEYDARNGAIVRLGAKHGIATPVNAAMVALLSAVRAR